MHVDFMSYPVQLCLYSDSNIIRITKLLFVCLPQPKAAFINDQTNGCWIPRLQTFCIWASQHLYKYTLGGSQSPSFQFGVYSPNIGPHGPKQSSPHGYTKHMGITPQSRPTRPETVSPHGYTKKHGYHTPITDHTNNQGPHGLKQLSPHGYTKHMGITPQSRPTWPETV